MGRRVEALPRRRCRRAGAAILKGGRRAGGFPTDLYCEFTVIDDFTDFWETFQPFGGAAGTDTGWGRGSLEEFTDLQTVVIDLASVK